MNAIISKDRAWEIAREFSEIARQEDVDDSILGVYVIGSLGADEYIPSRSDLDTALVAHDTVSGDLKSRLRAIRTELVLKYGISKDFGGIILQENGTYPPYDQEKEFVPEIYRLLVQGNASGEAMIWPKFPCLPAPTFEPGQGCSIHG